MKSEIKSIYHRLVQNTPMQHFRYLYSELNPEHRLSGIIGMRGVGKTTLLLQYLKSHYYQLNNALYFSADHFYFNSVSLYDFITELYETEGTGIFFIDEIHKHAGWNQQLKNIYDAYPKIRIIFSGSSSIDLIKGSYDLSRRAKLYYLNGLSFREYLNFSTGSTFDVIPYGSLLENTTQFDSFFAGIPQLAGKFHQYLSQGFYPFVFEDEASFYEKIHRVIEKTIYEDIASFYSIKTGNLLYFKRILYFLATIPPGQINTHNIAKKTGLDSKTVNNYFSMLNEIGLVRFVYPFGGGHTILEKPSKVFINNTTLLSALNHFLGVETTKGMERELFFLEALQGAGENIVYSKIGDYQVNKTIFEIGGKNKTRKQVKNNKEAIIVKDDIFISSKGVIPLCYFGFLY